MSWSATAGAAASAVTRMNGSPSSERSHADLLEALDEAWEMVVIFGAAGRGADSGPGGAAR
jgi:hypothetical protein